MRVYVHCTHAAVFISVNDGTVFQMQVSTIDRFDFVCVPTASCDKYRLLVSERHPVGLLVHGDIGLRHCYKLLCYKVDDDELLSLCQQNQTVQSFIIQTDTSDYSCVYFKINNEVCQTLQKGFTSRCLVPLNLPVNFKTQVQRQNVLVNIQFHFQGVSQFQHHKTVISPDYVSRVAKRMSQLKK